MNKGKGSKKQTNGGMKREYKLDYSKSRPNRFASAATNGPLVVIVDPDVAEVFKSSQSVNRALRALIVALPKPGQTKRINRQ
jgi:hypothetical protein